MNCPVVGVGSALLRLAEGFRPLEGEKDVVKVVVGAACLQTGDSGADHCKEDDDHSGHFGVCVDECNGADWSLLFLYGQV